MSNAAEPQAQAPVEVKGGIVPYLNVKGAIAAAEFYQRAFGAVIADQMPADDQGRTHHVHLYINGSSIMLSDPFPEMGAPHEAAQGFNLMLIVDDIESRFQRAVDAGAEVIAPVEKMFWGDTYGQLRCPYGIIWAMNQAG